MSRRGFNTLHGFDMGPPPPGFNHGQLPPFNFQAFTQQWSSQAMNPSAQSIHIAPAAAPQPPPQPALVYHFAQPAPAPAPAPAAPQPQPYPYLYPGQWPSAAPVSDGGIPGIHLRNNTGGVGLPPGYNYLFPPTSCQIHVFKTATAPWDMAGLSKDDARTHVKLVVPCNTSVKDLMQGLGCNNPDAAKNVLYEVTETGNGAWSRGLVIKGDDKERVNQEIREFAWTEARTGLPGEQPVVWLWATKD
ncbi:hypothetical protein PVAG01_08172 [Phlyctema vagabunda]|uniref:Uncharacterized protein n=1 Tax=Phlyctema vagabunda TaxID=108571 RepID=A0ABR4P8P4_9HELO